MLAELGNPVMCGMFLVAPGEKKKKKGKKVEVLLYLEVLGFLSPQSAQ